MDNGPEFVAKAVREWIAAAGAKTASIEPGSPSGNGYCESFNSKLRDALLNGEIFYTLQEAKVIIENALQHRSPTLFARLPTTCTGGLHDRRKLAHHLDHRTQALHAACSLANGLDGE
jgi:transposase InsO family protein